MQAKVSQLRPQPWQASELGVRHTTLIFPMLPPALLPSSRQGTPLPAWVPACLACTPAALRDRDAQPLPKLCWLPHSYGGKQACLHPINDALKASRQQKTPRTEGLPSPCSSARLSQPGSSLRTHKRDAVPHSISGLLPSSWAEEIAQHEFPRPVWRGEGLVPPWLHVPSPRPTCCSERGCRPVPGVLRSRLPVAGVEGGCWGGSTLPGTAPTTRGRLPALIRPPPAGVPACSEEAHTSSSSPPTHPGRPTPTHLPPGLTDSSATPPRGRCPGSGGDTPPRPSPPRSFQPTIACPVPSPPPPAPGCPPHRQRSPEQAVQGGQLRSQGQRLLHGVHRRSPRLRETAAAEGIRVLQVLHPARHRHLRHGSAATAGGGAATPRPQARPAPPRPGAARRVPPPAGAARPGAMLRRDAPGDTS